MLAVALVQALLMAWLVPPWMGEDEPWHFEYAAHIAAGERPGLHLVSAPSLDPPTLDLPVSHTMLRLRFPATPPEEVAAMEQRLLESMARHDFARRVDWAPDLEGTRSFDALLGAITAAQQPPLYFLLLGIWLAPVRSLSLETQLVWARIPSAFAYLFAVWTALRLGQAMARDQRVAILAGLASALWPMHARQSAVVNNDVLAKAAVCVALLAAIGLAGRSAGLGARVRFLIVLAIAPFAKGTAVAAFALAPLAVLRRVGDAASRRRAMIVLAAASLLLSVGFLLALAKSPILPGGLTDLVQRMQTGWGADRLGNLGRTLVGMFGWYQRSLPPWVYDLAAAVAGVAVCGAVVGVVRAAVVRVRGTRADSFATALLRPRARALFVLVLVLVATQFALVALRGVTAGRYLFPAIAPLAVLLALGWMALAPARARGALALVLTAALLLLNAAFVVHGLIGEEWLRRAA